MLPSHKEQGNMLSHTFLSPHPIVEFHLLCEEEMEILFYLLSLLSR